MLELNGDECKVANVNYRTEKHGEKEVPALDIELVANMAPSVLDMLVPGLREAMFRPKDPAHPEAGLARCFPQLGPLKIAGEWPGYTADFQRGEISGNTVGFEAVILNKLRVTLVEGGSVTLQFQLQIGGPPEYLERAVPMLALTMPVHLKPPYGDDLVAQAEKGKKKPKAGTAEKQAAGEGETLPTPKPPADPGAPPTVDPMKGTDLEQKPGGDETAQAAAKEALDKAAKRGEAAKK